MQSLILHPTCVAQWHALLGEAQKTCAIHLKEDIESYLVFLLMRFVDNPALASSVVGLDFLHSYQKRSLGYTQNGLKEVGDKCLLFAGLFPGRAIKRRVKISYFVKLGQTAYSLVSQQFNQEESLFTTLCLQFPQLMDILQATRDTSYLAHNLLQAFELWQETGSQAAWQRLCEATQGLPSMLDIKKSSH